MARVRAQFIFGALWIMLKYTGVDSQNLTSMKGQVGQLLPYWEPESWKALVARRSVVNNNFIIKPIIKLPKNQTYRRGRPLEPIIDWSSHEGDALVVTERQKRVKVKKNKYNDGRGPMSFRQMKMRAKEEESRSTRIAPLHLMQQEEQPQATEYEKQKGIETYSDQFILNSYFVEKQFTRLLSEFNDVEFTTEILGRTVSYIQIVLFKISAKGTKFFRADDDKYVENEIKEKKILFIVHALSPMGLGNLFSLTLESHLKLLLSYYFAHLDKFDIYLIPMANPDGYLEARAIPHWNKNVAPSAACPGVDVDRNFDVAWNNSQAKDSSCTQHFPGPTPFSEAESRAVRDVFHRMSHKIVAYFHVHGGTYSCNTFKGDAVLYPKGYADHQSDDDKYIDLKAEIDEAIKNANFKVLSVSVDTLYNWYGKVSGSSVDYAATVYGIPYSMEFVMQLYQDSVNTLYNKITKLGDAEIESVEFLTLREIWKRVIDVVFTNIYKKLEANEAARL